VDVQRLKGQILNVISGYVELKRKHAGEYVGLCPFHAETTPSFSVSENKQFYYCFGCGAKGDTVDFVQDMEGVDFKTAVKMLGGELRQSNRVVAQRKPMQAADPYAGYTPILPPAELKDGNPVYIENPRADKPKPKRWRPEMVFPYRNVDGFVERYVIRSIMPSGKKITPAVHWCRKPDGSEGWTLYPTPEPRTLINLDQIAKSSGQIVIVEGEKAARAGSITADGVTFTTWQGGTQAIDKTDFTPLAGRSVVIIPDHDAPGYQAARELVAKLTGVASSIKTVIPPADSPDGWDIADKQWQPGELLAWCKANIGELPPDESAQEPESAAEHTADQASENTAEQTADYPGYDDQPPPPENMDNEDLRNVIADYAVRPNPGKSFFPFRVLGYRRNDRYYLPQKTRQVILLSPGSHTKQNLMSLAGLDFWLASFGDGQDAKSIKWDHAINAMLSESAAAGLFNPYDAIRGRGAWIDKKRTMLHVGDAVFIDGVETDPGQVDSQYIYELNDPISIPLADPATDDESRRIIEIMKKLSWENPLSAPLLAGWCVIAPICGMLHWRPHIWVTGPAGSGKSTVCGIIINRMLGKTVIKAEGKTTEPGLRQSLGRDARPIIFDEAEAEDAESTRRVQSIIDFARVCSSGGDIKKGDQSGQGISYTARACFCFSSINTSVKHFADETRISTLVLKRDISPGAIEKYQGIEAEIQDVFTEEFGARMLARAIKYSDVLQDNCRVFTDAAAIVFRSRRTADQIGALLAGAFLTYSPRRVTKEAAIEWIQKHEWSDHTTVSSASDFERLLSKISNHRITIKGDHDQHSITVGEAIVLAGKLDIRHPLFLLSGQCDMELRRHGIKVDLDGVLVASSCDPMRHILRDSPWAASWARVMGEHPQSQKLPNRHFVPGVQSRCVKLPMSVFFDGGMA